MSMYMFMYAKYTGSMCLCIMLKGPYIVDRHVIGSPLHHHVCLFIIMSPAKSLIIIILLSPVQGYTLAEIKHTKEEKSKAAQSSEVIEKEKDNNVTQSDIIEQDIVCRVHILIIFYTFSQILEESDVNKRREGSKSLPTQAPGELSCLFKAKLDAIIASNKSDIRGTGIDPEMGNTNKTHIPTPSPVVCPFIVKYFVLPGP